MKKKRFQKSDNKSLNWGPIIKKALAQDKIIKAVFCPRCIWLIQKLVTVKVAGKIKVVAKQHHLWHLKEAMQFMISSDRKIVTFKKKL